MNVRIREYNPPKNYLDLRLYRLPNQPLKYVEDVIKEYDGEIKNALFVGGTLYSTHAKSILGKDVEVDCVEINPITAQYELIVAKIVENGKTPEEALDLLQWPSSEVVEKCTFKHKYPIKVSKLLNELPIIQQEWKDTYNGPMKDFLKFIETGILNIGQFGEHKHRITKSYSRAILSDIEIYDDYNCMLTPERIECYRFNSLKQMKNTLSKRKFIYTAHNGNEIQEDWNRYYVSNIRSLNPSTDVNIYIKDIMDFETDRKYDIILSNNVFQPVAEVRYGYEKRNKGVKAFTLKMESLLNKNGILEMTDLFWNAHIKECFDLSLKTLNADGLNTNLKFVKNLSYEEIGDNVFIFQKV